MDGGVSLVGSWEQRVPRLRSCTAEGSPPTLRTVSNSGSAGLERLAAPVWPCVEAIRLAHLVWLNSAVLQQTELTEIRQYGIRVMVRRA